MHYVTITVSGPGSNINFEVELVKRALETAGLKVILENDHPIEFRHDSHCKTIEEYLDFRINLAKTSSEEIKLVADHVPWGG